MRGLWALAAAGAAALHLLAGGGLAQAQTPDPYLWLEEANGPRAMEWVGKENAKTLSQLTADPRFKVFEGEALAIAEAKDRIPTPRFLAGSVFNFWRDADHVRGIWRKTSLDDYARASPSWTTVLDVDAYSKAQGANYVVKGETCEELKQRRCLIELSDGGEDAVTIREFDLPSSAFVSGGFDLAKGKQRADFETEDQLLVSREWSKGELTASGYPFIVKRVKRGEDLGRAVEIFRGSKADGGYGVTPLTLVDGQGRRASFIVRPLSTFQSEIYLVGAAGVRRLGLPLKSSLEALVAGRLIVRVEEDWTAGGVTTPAGSVVSLDLAAVRAAPLALKPHRVFSPGPRQGVLEVAATKDRLILIALDNVRGRGFVFRPTPTGWSSSALTLPDNLTIGIVDADRLSDRAFLSVTGFLTPPSVSLLDADDARLALLKTLPPKFDASKEVVEQFEATSKDGVKVPYFVVRPKDGPLDGSGPTILTAYGGFQVSRTPAYSGGLGKLWLERGGTFVLANIRGGGEFGPAWHEAGLKTKRQVIYDDFAAVAEDLIRRGISSQRRLGIQGGSNGGLLMGVEFTQRPDLWRAVDIQVPLLDMVRYEKIAAGASWVGEYGSVSVPAERAFLEKISPYANLKPGVAYPEPFIWTTTKDDRVGPQHARKFAAKLAALGDPYLFYEVVEGGHGSGANLKEQARTQALEMTYFAERLID